MARILLVDDDPGVRELLEFICTSMGHEVCSLDRAPKALKLLESESFDVVVQDLKMPEMDGIELLKRLKQAYPRLPVIIVTAFSTWDNAVGAMRLGAYDYLRKPFDNDEVRAVVARALHSKEVGNRIKGRKDLTVSEMIGNSASIQEVREMVNRVAHTDSTILIRGESGTGKELVAHSVHCTSHRIYGPFVTVNCAAFNESLLESELFGHVRGAFTDAHRDKKGLFELASGGTLFLDEVGEMSQGIQSKFLRVLQERRFYHVGGSSPIEVDVRIIGATNRDLEAAVASNEFRRDLFYRLNVIPILLPPLRERTEDLPLLIGHFLKKYSTLFHSNVNRLSKSAIQKLLHHDWPGNIRELENVIQRSVALASGDEIETVQLGMSLSRETDNEANEQIAIPDEGLDLEARMADIERSYLLKALERTNGHLTNAAQLLNISFRSMRYKVQKFGLKSLGSDKGV